MILGKKEGDRFGRPTLMVYETVSCEDTVLLVVLILGA